MFKENEARKEITEIIEEMRINEQYYLFCEYCEECNMHDDRPEMTSEIDDLLCGMKPSEIIEKYGDLNTNWDYFNYDGYGNIQEWTGIDYVSDVVDEIISREESFENDDIQEVLDRYSNTEELYIEKEDFEKVVDILEEKEIEYEYDESEVKLTILFDSYDDVTEILDELEIEY